MLDLDLLTSCCGIFPAKVMDIAAASSADAYNFPECDYDMNPTPLYKAIENKQWAPINQYLLTGYWHGSFFSDPTPPKEQACTWVTKYERTNGRKIVKWTHLPIHAAVIYGAPEGIVELLVKLAPPSIRCADDQRMLPLHLAFRTGSTDTILQVLLDVFPESVAVRDFKGRTPVQCAAEGPNAKRGHIIQVILQNNEKAWGKKHQDVQNKQLDKLRESLRRKVMKYERLEAAYDKLDSREERIREAFSLVVAELKEITTWYYQIQISANDDIGAVQAPFVKEVAKKLASLENFADRLRHQNSKKRVGDTESAGSATESTTSRDEESFKHFDAVKVVQNGATELEVSSGNVPSGKQPQDANDGPTKLPKDISEADIKAAVTSDSPQGALAEVLDFAKTSTFHKEVPTEILGAVTSDVFKGLSNDASKDAAGELTPKDATQETANDVPEEVSVEISEDTSVEISMGISAMTSVDYSTMLSEVDAEIRELENVSTQKSRKSVGKQSSRKESKIKNAKSFGALQQKSAKSSRKMKNRGLLSKIKGPIKISPTM